MNESKTWKFCVDIAYDIIGSFFYAVGIVCFAEPANMAPGGLAGISILLNYLWKFPIGLTTVLLNVPLLTMSFLFLGKMFTFKTMKSLIISSAIIDLVVTPYFPVYTSDRLMGAVFGGLLIGAGVALIFSRGSTTGGVDIITFLIRKWRPHMSIGQIVMLVNGAILVASIYVFKDIDAGFYGLIAQFCSSKIIDSILYGSDKGSMVTVVSDKNREIADQIMKELKRGVTLLNGRGGYTEQEKEVLICAVKKQQFAGVRRIIYKNDPDAFVIVSETKEVLGAGFGKIKDE